MVKVVYTGLRDPVRDFEALRPAYSAVIAMKMKCPPSSPDYMALQKIIDAMNEAARHFIPTPPVTAFFGSKPTG